MSGKFYRNNEHGAVNVIYIPDDCSIDDDGDFLGYGATRLISNDAEVATMWFNPSLLREAITEEEARSLHPALFAHLDAINRGEI